MYCTLFHFLVYGCGCCVALVLCEEVVCVWLKHFTLSALSFQTAGAVQSLFNPSVQSSVHCIVFKCSDVTRLHAPY